MRCQLIFTCAAPETPEIPYEEQRALVAELRDYGVEIDDVILVSYGDCANGGDSPWVNRRGADLAFVLRPPLDVEGLLNYVAATGRATTFVSRPDWEAADDNGGPITHVAYVSTPHW